MTLTIQDLGALGEFFGSIAVLVTLVYLALQTRQNTMAISAQLEAAALGANQDMYLSIATSNELEEALADDRTTDMTTNQWRRAVLFGSLLNSMQWHIHQSRRGLLPTFNEAGAGANVRNFFAAFRSFEGWWEARKAIYLPEFVEWVDEQRAKATGQEALGSPQDL